MALVTARVTTDFKFEGKKVKAGDDIVVQRKPAVELQSKELITIGRVLDPRNTEDKPLIDKYLEAHPVEEKGAPAPEEAKEE